MTPRKRLHFRVHATPRGTRFGVNRRQPPQIELLESRRLFAVDFVPDPPQFSASENGVDAPVERGNAASCGTDAAMDGATVETASSPPASRVVGSIPLAAARAGVRVELRMDGVALKVVRPGPSGAWAVPLPAALPAGLHVLTARGVDRQGGVGAESSPLTIVVDAAGPAVISATVPPATPDVVTEPGSAPGLSVLNRGDVVTVSVLFDEPVEVHGQPTIALRIGDRKVRAAYGGGTATDTLTFNYTVRRGDNGPLRVMPRLEWPTPRPGALPGITDAQGHAAARLFVAPDTRDFAVVTTPRWPSMAAWRRLAASLDGQLIRAPQPPWAALQPGEQVPASFNNPYWMSSFAGGANLVGMQGAWASTPSAYAVAAETPRDVSEAVRFARRNGLKVVVKGTGHDYFGRSTGSSDSLLIWTHRMQAVEVQEAFIATGAPSGAPTEQAVTARAGNFWVDVWGTLGQYNRDHPDNQRYAQGASSGTVGVGGWTLGGGFALLSKRYGSGASGVLEMEVVLADGSTVICNDYQNQDLFRAMKGGGGGTFGIMTSITFKTFPQPSQIGTVSGNIVPNSETAYRDLIKAFYEFLPAISNDKWGGGIVWLRDAQYQPEPFTTGQTVASLYPFNYVDLTVDEARAVWEPFLAPLRARPNDFRVEIDFPELSPFSETFAPTPEQYAAVGVTADPADPSRWWQPGVGYQASGFWEGWSSRGVPRESLEPDRIDQLVDAVYQGSLHNTILFEIGKGLYGAGQDVVARERRTSINPAFLNSVGLMSILNIQTDVFPRVKGHRPDSATAARHAQQIYAAADLLTRATPGGGSYFNQGDYFMKNWAIEFWGYNYAQLLQAKQKYDPGNFFRVHQGVGSDVPVSPPLAP